MKNIAKNTLVRTLIIATGLLSFTTLDVQAGKKNGGILTLYKPTRKLSLAEHLRQLYKDLKKRTKIHTIALAQRCATISEDLRHIEPFATFFDEQLFAMHCKFADFADYLANEKDSCEKEILQTNYSQETIVKDLATLDLSEYANDAHYGTLSISQETFNAIAKQYRQMALRNHPDMFTTESDKLRQTEAFKTIVSAFENIKNYFETQGQA